MQKIIFTLIAFIFCQFIYSQTEKTDQLLKDCETASTKYYLLLSKYSIEQKTQIREVLNLWKATCSKTEPILRAKILLEISENSFTDTVYTNYFNNHIFDYFDRINAAYQEDYKDVYEINKEYFNYVPLRSGFDDWTYNFAQKLKSQQKPRTEKTLLEKKTSSNKNINPLAFPWIHWNKAP